jgi:SAM-dependent methyltransferase
MSAGDVDVAALFARLKEEVRGTRNSVPPAQRLRRLREQAEASWAVSDDNPLEGSRPARAVKRVLRKLMRWYVAPIVTEQRTFNDATLKLLDSASARVDGLTARVDGLETRLAEVTALDERLTRLERRERMDLPAQTVAPQPNAAALPDYFAFEAKMRASTGEIRERQRPYVEDLRDAAPILDLGCGRGELLALLRDEGVEARGVDADADMVAYARGEGLDVEQADAVAYLEGVEDGTLGGVFAAQLVEHLPPPALVRLLELAARKLRPGGVLIAETINPLSPIALRHYFADLTHAQPLVPETLELLARQSGFTRTELRFLNAPSDRLEEPEDELIAQNVRRLNEIVFAPLDYALVASV